jgi:hypothetical protein
MPDTEYRTIPLTQGQVAIVDAADYEWLMQWKWQALWDPHTQSFRAVRTEYFRVDGKRAQKAITMHRLILNAQPDIKVDHIDHNTLNNRRYNLRAATQTQNSAHNRRMHRNNTSGYRGVRFYQYYGEPGRWVARITRNGKLQHLGYFNTPEEASNAYENAAREHRGEFYLPHESALRAPSEMHTKPRNTSHPPLTHRPDYESAHRKERRALGLCPYCRSDEKPTKGVMCETCKKKARYHQTGDPSWLSQ